jgi:hypothetical protein
VGDAPVEQLDFLYMPSRDAVRELTFYHSQIVFNPATPSRAR